MAEIIEKQELSVIITKVKIGKKDLTKKIIDQISWGDFVYCEHENGSQELGLPYIISDNDDELIFDKDKPYIIDGTLIGYITPTWDDSENRQNTRSRWGEFNRVGKFYFIIWYDGMGRLKKGYVDAWTFIQLEIDIESMKIFI